MPTFYPQYPFGFGLSYTNYGYSNLRIANKSVVKTGSLEVSAEVSNTGKNKGTEIVQLYIQQLVGDVVRSVE